MDFIYFLLVDGSEAYLRKDQIIYLESEKWPDGSITTKIGFNGEMWYRTKETLQEVISLIRK